MSTRLRTTDELLAWMGDHPRQVGLVVRRGGVSGGGGVGTGGASGAEEPSDGAVSGTEEVRHNATAGFPLAATRTVLILGAYAEAVAQRRLDPDEPVPLPDVQRWWARGTDGGAHLGAERDWRRRERVGRGKVLTVPLDEIAHGMVRWSSNACGDYVLDRLGVDTVDAWAARRGMTDQQSVYPMYGELAGWIHYGDAWVTLAPEERRAAMSGAPSRPVSRWRMARLGAATQARLASVSCKGTPDDWAALVDRVYTNGSGMAREEVAVMRRHLGWAREVSERNAQRFTVFASKGGSAAGVLTEVSYATPVGGEPCVVVQFYRDLPLPVWKAVTRSLVHQRLVLELATGTRPLSDLRSAFTVVG